MKFNRHLIAPLGEGLRTDLRPWLIPDDAFSRLNNAYIFRGRLKKRYGSKYTGTGTGATANLSSRLRVLLGTSVGGGTYSTTVPGAIFKIGQQFSVGTEIFTVVETGTPGNLISTGSGSGTFNTTSGVLSLTGVAGTTAVYYYPSEPVMGLTQYEQGTIHNQTAYAFDTQFIYKFSGGAWIREGSVVLTGTNSNFVWAYNWEGAVAKDTALFITNFKAADGMYYYNGTSWSSKWTPQFLSATAGLNSILTAKIIIPFKNRLLLLNTVETDATASPNTNQYSYVNRIRYSQNGSPVATNAFQEPNQAVSLGGGYIDAPTEEEIVSAALIRDRLIVFFERSAYEIAYTGNDALPFIFQQLNAERGSESTFSIVKFDSFMLNVGTNGVQECNGLNVERIDEKIPDEVFDIRITNEGPLRVAGIRDYFKEVVFWTIPTDDNQYALTYPNKTLVFNYKNGTWAMNDDTITCFGYFEQETGITWQQMTNPWYTYTAPWQSNVNASQFRQIIAGNQHGFVTILRDDITFQASNLIVTDTAWNSSNFTLTLTILDHNLQNGDYVRVDNLFGASEIYQIGVEDKDEIILYEVISDPGTYEGGATVARVPLMDIVSKEWNPYKDENSYFTLAKIDFGVARQSEGAVTVDYSTSHTDLSMNTESYFSDAALGNGILECTAYSLVPLESQQNLLWHPIYINGEGDSVSIRIYLNADQMLDIDKAQAGFELEGLVLYTYPTGTR